MALDDAAWAYTDSDVVKVSRITNANAYLLNTNLLLGLADYTCIKRLNIQINESFLKMSVNKYKVTINAETPTPPLSVYSSPSIKVLNKGGWAGDVSGMTAGFKMAPAPVSHDARDYRAFPMTHSECSHNHERQRLLT